MAQMSLFSRTEIAGMRDWTAARNHCPERDAFRREHEQHRAWGLRRRHAAKLRHIQDSRSTPPTTPASRNDQTRPSSPAQRTPTRQAPARQAPTRQAPTRQAPTRQASTPQAASPQAASPQAAISWATAAQAPPPPAATPQAPPPPAAALQGAAHPQQLRRSGSQWQPRGMRLRGRRLGLSVMARRSPAPASRRTPQPTGPTNSNPAGCGPTSNPAGCGSPAATPPCGCTRSRCTKSGSGLSGHGAGFTSTGLAAHTTNHRPGASTTHTRPPPSDPTPRRGTSPTHRAAAGTTFTNTLVTWGGGHGDTRAPSDAAGLRGTHHSVVRVDKPKKHFPPRRHPPACDARRIQAVAPVFNEREYRLFTSRRNYVSFMATCQRFPISPCSVLNSTKLAPDLGLPSW
jgi:hypothetical protein